MREDLEGHQVGPARESHIARASQHILGARKPGVVRLAWNQGLVKGGIWPTSVFGTVANGRPGQRDSSLVVF